MLTFLAGAEVDPDDFRDRLGASFAKRGRRQRGAGEQSRLRRPAEQQVGDARGDHERAGEGDDPDPVLLARRYARPDASFATLLMSTGLTFGTISALYGLGAGIINQTQFSLLVTVVVLSAIVPTAIAQRWFAPDAEAERAAEAQRLAQPIPAEEYV